MTLSYESLFKSGNLQTSPMSPINLFKVIEGSILKGKNNRSHEYSIELVLAPFLWSGEIVDTSIRLDSVVFKNTGSFEDLSNKAFSFPINPNDGYIDGSVYIESMHNWIDVRKISFGSRYKEISTKRNEKEDYIVATLLYQFCWEGEDLEFYPEINRANVILKYIN